MSAVLADLLLSLGQPAPPRLSGFRDIGPSGSHSALCRSLPPSCPRPVLTCPARGQVLPGTWKIPAVGPGGPALEPELCPRQWAGR
ncbi:hypothetical protein Celaphus_00015548 [Cervus elaphus hippelaphus]|uniref:Uncharacterized protein n=1 Tax=Cervus elaphus hippelaphus TaxID=46360 RepID=A0A212CT38_CEREH|nr:hypothetical protein Celaphus_00015548 [Cervus elaphus hippelaphus]